MKFEGTESCTHMEFEGLVVRSQHDEKKKLVVKRKCMIFLFIVQQTRKINKKDRKKVLI